MRCVACEIELVTSAPYCEGCASRLSLPETSVFETPVIEADQWAADGDPASDGRCDSCGGPQANGDLCGACQRAFFSSWLDGSGPAAPVSEMATPIADALPNQENSWSGLATSVSSAYDPSDALTRTDVAVPAPVLPEAALTSVDDTAAAANAEVVKADEARAQAGRGEGAKTQVALPKGARAEATSAERTPKPAVTRSPDVPVRSSRRRHAIALAVVAVVVAAIGAGAYLLRFHESPIAREEAETLVAKNATVARRRPSAGGLSAEAPTGRQSVVAPPEVPAPARPTPASSAPIEAPAKAVRSPIPSTRLIESLVVTALETEAPPPVDASPTPDVVATAPPRPSAPPVSPFFQTTDVNESPRVATRVEPLVPDELRARPLNEIVVVRVLVSQGGHPSRISLLRRSKAGPRLDNAVMAAVNQWTFSPARKSGEAVSCWFNVGVPVGGAD